MKQWIGLMAVLTATAHAEIVGGPKGGKLLEGTSPVAEFFVNTERKIEIAFYDESLNPVSVGQQTARMMIDAPDGKVVLEMEKHGDLLMSTASLPAGDGYLIVVQLRNSPDERPRNFRIAHHSDICAGCDRAEYACTCDDTSDHSQGHRP